MTEKREPVPVSFSDLERTFASLPPVILKNRIYEKNPTQGQGDVTLSRWGSTPHYSFGTGPFRGAYSERGLFSGALFVVSGNYCYRQDTDGTVVQLAGYIYGSGQVSMQGQKGIGYERLFLADGSHLQLYQGGTHASGVLTGTANVLEGDEVQIGTTHFRWSATIVNGDGTATTPWIIALGVDLATSLANLVAAISFTGTAGTTYSGNLAGQNGDVTAVSDTTTLTATAITDLAAGNLIDTLVTTDGGAVLSWGSATLTGGGTHGLSGVAVPDGKPPFFLAMLDSYIIVLIHGSDTFFFIAPGAVVINALDFMTAESHPDALVAVFSTGDNLVFLGTDSLEVWYATGSLNAPFAPVKGRTFLLGAIEGTCVKLHDTIFFVSSENVAYMMEGRPIPISKPAIAEIIRKGFA